MYLPPASTVKVPVAVNKAVAVVVEPVLMVTLLKEDAVVIEGVVPLKFTVLVDLVKVALVL